jgi:hypothetical protein
LSHWRGHFGHGRAVTSTASGRTTSETFRRETKFVPAPQSRLDRVENRNMYIFELEHRVQWNMIVDSNSWLANSWGMNCEEFFLRYRATWHSYDISGNNEVMSDGNLMPLKWWCQECFAALAVKLSNLWKGPVNIAWARCSTGVDPRA